MVENLIVMLIVGASAWYAGARYVPATWRGKAATPKSGCGSGCSSCNSCETAVAEPTGRRVIMMQRQH